MATIGGPITKLRPEWCKPHDMGMQQKISALFSFWPWPRKTTPQPPCFLSCSGQRQAKSQPPCFLSGLGRAKPYHCRPLAGRRAPLVAQARPETSARLCGASPARLYLPSGNHTRPKSTGRLPSGPHPALGRQSGIQPATVVAQATPVPYPASNTRAASRAASVTVSPASIRAISSTRAPGASGVTVDVVMPSATCFSTRQ